MEKRKRREKALEKALCKDPDQVYVAHMLCISDQDRITLKQKYDSYFKKNSGAQVTQCYPIDGAIPTVRCRFLRTAEHYHWRGTSVSLGVAEYIPKSTKRIDLTTDRELLGVEILGSRDCLEKRISEFREASRKRGAKIHLIHKGPCNGRFYENELEY